MVSENYFSPLLQPGESVADISAPIHGSQEWAFGYGFGEIQDSTYQAGNSVVLEVELEGAVEPVLITHDITLTVRAVQGTGLAVIYNVEKQGDVDVVELSTEHAPLTLVRGDAYYYLNSGDESLILRDDCAPAFQGDEEILLTSRPKTEGIDGRTVKLPRAFWQGFELTK